MAKGRAGMIKRYGTPPRNNVQYRRRPGVYAILLRGHNVLLTFQDAPHFEYQLPGGGIDPGESPITALHREVFEETGWRIDTPRKLGAFRKFTFMPEYDLWAEKLCHIYVARPVLRLGPPAEPDHTAIWTSQATAIDVLANDGDRAFVAGLS